MSTATPYGPQHVGNAGKGPPMSKPVQHAAIARSHRSGLLCAFCPSALAHPFTANIRRSGCTRMSHGPTYGARTSALTTAVLIASMTHEYAQTGITMRRERALYSAWPEGFCWVSLIAEAGGVVRLRSCRPAGQCHVEESVQRSGACARSARAPREIRSGAPAGRAVHPHDRSA